jgi:hypothetical protein
MNQFFTAIDEYLSNIIHDRNNDDEKEELILRDLCILCNCNLDSDIYDDGIFYVETGIAYHLACKCKLHLHEACIDNYIKCESQCPQCEKPLQKAPFLKTLWIFFVRFFDAIR